MYNTKNVRELIFKGASRDIQNNDGKKPIDLLENFEDQVLKEELNQILGVQPCYLPCFHIKQPLKKLEKSKVTMMSFLGMTLGSLLLLLMFVLPFEGPRQHIYTILGWYAGALIFFFATACKDSGIVKKSDKISFLKLNQYFDPSYICPTCEILRPQDSRHCYICNKCIDRFDHHCQWVNTCIGVGNHSMFYLFLITIWSYLIFLDYVCFSNIDLVVTHDVVKEAINSHIVNAFFQQVSDHKFANNPLRFLFMPGLLGELYVQIYYDVVLLITITAASFFLLPLTLLLIVQTKNFLSNQTT